MDIENGFGAYNVSVKKHHLNQKEERRRIEYQNAHYSYILHQANGQMYELDIRPSILIQEMSGSSPIGTVPINLTFITQIGKLVAQ